MRQVSIIYNGLIIKKTFVINERYLGFDEYFRINILKKLLKRRLIQYKNNFCKILNFKTVEHLIISLLVSRCVPIINKEWITYLPLIDNDFYWSKATVILDSEAFFTTKYLYKHPSLVYQRNEMIMYGRNLLMWNFKNLTPIVSNILTFLEKLFTGDISEKFIKAVNLYKEDERLFEIERNKQPVINKFTVIFTTYKRNKLLNISMSKLDSVPNIDKIIVIWNNPNSSYLPDKNSWCKTFAPKFFIKTKSNSLNNKFLPYDIIKTEAVLTLDDDQNVDQHLILYLFEVWKQHKDVIVGYYRRFGGNDYERSYITTYKHIYNLILTGLSFINKKYLHYFTYKFPAIYKKKIDMRKNCEDIAFNYLVSFFSNKPNIAYSVEYELSLINGLFNFNYTALSLDKMHYKVRKYCTLELNRLFMINPMISNIFYIQEFVAHKKKLNTSSNYPN
uniref:Glyco_transf_64 domain-containing protein n=1 Tax=Strongyloides papillosus TaxID=174720 RepID=A0A0N5C991_STREA